MRPSKPSFSSARQAPARGPRPGKWPPASPFPIFEGAFPPTTWRAAAPGEPAGGRRTAAVPACWLGRSKSALRPDCRRGLVTRFPARIRSGSSRGDSAAGFFLGAPRVVHWSDADQFSARLTGRPPVGWREITILDAPRKCPRCDHDAATVRAPTIARSDPRAPQRLRDSDRPWCILPRARRAADRGRSGLAATVPKGVSGLGQGPVVLREMPLR